MATVKIERDLKAVLIAALVNVKFAIVMSHIGMEVTGDKGKHLPCEKGDSRANLGDPSRCQVRIVLFPKPWYYALQSSGNHLQFCVSYSSFIG